MEDMFKIFPSTKFVWDKNAYTLTTNKEDVPGFLRWLDGESMMMGLAIRSVNTGNIRKFKINEVVRDEHNVIICWEFRVAEEAIGPLADLRVLVLN